MKRILALLITILISQTAFNQNYQSDFENYFQSNDTLNQLKVLTNWHLAKPKDAELYTSYFNYHFIKSKQEFLTLSNDQPHGDGLILNDSLNNTVGSMGSQIHYNPTEIEKAFTKIDKGIELYPNRLDMRFGKIYVLGELSDWENFTSEIIKTVRYSSTNNNHWTWTNNEKIDRGEKDFLLDIQTYQLQLYNTGDDNLLKYMREIAHEVLKHYPNHVESLSNLSITYLLTGAFDKGIEALLRAEKINPKDFIVLTNIAQGYKLKGDSENAIKYYKKALECGDEKTKEHAKQQILELKK